MGSMMRSQIGFLLQLAALVFLPVTILWQLNFGFNPIYMPALLIVGIVVFSIGARLRES